MSSLKKNIGYQSIFQILNTCIPLVTSPYLARTLGASQQGVFSYTQSVVTYFTLFCMLGVVNYGTRVIAETANSRKKRSIEFWNIYFLQSFSSIILLVVYLFYIFILNIQNKEVALIQGIYIIGAFFDISWLYWGCEKFEITVKRNMCFRVISVVLILLLVNKPNDLWIYTMIMAGSVFVTNFSLWFVLHSVVDIRFYKHIKLKYVKKHILPNLKLFIPLAAMSIYHIMDKTMLGILSTNEQNGYYYNADKIINIPICILTGIGTVLLPRMSLLISSGKEEKANKLFDMVVRVIAFISTAMAFGISAISEEFVPFFFGTGFESCKLLIMVLSPVLIFKGIGNIVSTQYLIPHHHERYYLEAVLAGAFVNLCSNILLIPQMGAMGAVIGTLSAEFISCLWQLVRIRKEIQYTELLKEELIYILSGFVMYWFVRQLSSLFADSFVNMLIEIGAGIIFYIILFFVLWRFTNNKVINLIKNMIIIKKY